MTRVGILVCDHFPDGVRSAAGGDVGDLYVELLGAADATIDTAVFDAVRGELPDPGSCDAWIITGSRADAHSDEAWVVALREWVATVAATRERIAGICFGHQLVAHALGGRSERAAGWKVGPQEMTVADTAWFDGATVAVNAMHRDEVTELPPGGHPIATGSTATYPAFTIGDHVLCVQDHPEFTNSLTRTLIEGRVDRLGEEIAADGLSRVEAMATHGRLIGEWLAAFLADRRR